MPSGALGVDPSSAPIPRHTLDPGDAAGAKLASSLGHLNDITGHEACRDEEGKVFSNWKGHRDLQLIEERRDALRALYYHHIVDNAHRL